MSQVNICSAPPIPSTADASSRRWNLIDALRGFALAGILFVNVPDITRLGSDIPFDRRQSTLMDTVLEFAVQTRFVPIFAFLFGLSAMLVIQSARRRGTGALVPMLLRLGTLLLIGIAHGFLYPGEILREYAICGILMLPLMLWLPRWALLWSGVVLTVAAYAVTGGGLTTLPGLFLAGAGAAAYGLPKVLDAGGRPVWLTFLVATALAVPAIVWQTTEPGDPRFTNAGGIAGGILAVVYLTGFALLWQTPVRRVLAAVFEPLGRMALTNYLAASVVFVGVGLLVPFREIDDLAAVSVGALVLIAVQSVLSRLWLRHYRYGPVEWVWRMATWRRAVPLRGAALPAA
ncbi:DUF418 domain-containing protein [Plantibacter sp. lyk4-40-MEA-4]|uniref:DUF418 domain-containing protein n=1 Tax=Plantibacter sp. lyk4-40-MEA-4 TaxID=3040298 RepID=UPI00255038BE|nr:DUF418 domain-containing protein [Plantibacter sp. lyk4-40-MEA-4]